MHKRLPKYTIVVLILTATACKDGASPAAEPTNDEQLLIELVNRARSNPPKYATDFGLAVPLTDATPKPPLALNTALVGSARFHAQEMATFNYFDHQSAVTGDWPNKMAKDNGYPLPALWEFDNNYIESIAAGTTSPTQTLNLLLIDEGIDPPGHRIHLLAMQSFFATHDEIGAGHAFNASSTYRNYWAIHTALDDDAQKFVTGVVYSDTTTADYFYTPGKGLGGVSVEALTPGTNSVVASTTTFASGGYSLKLANGFYDIRFRGAPLAQPIVHNSVQVGSANAKIDSLSLWNQNAGGAWSAPGNWLGGVPNGIGAAAVLYSKTAAARTIDVGQATVGQLRFQNSGGFTLVPSAPGRLDFDVAGGDARISTIGSGAHAIRSDIIFHDDTVLSVDAAGSLALSLAHVRNEGKTLTKTGTGTLEIGGKLTFDLGSSFRALAGVTNFNADTGSAETRPMSLEVTGAGTQVNLNSSQHLDSLAIGSGVVRLAAGGNRTLTLNSLSFDTPPTPASPIPEPSGIALATVVAALLGYRRARN